MQLFSDTVPLSIHKYKLYAVPNPQPFLSAMLLSLQSQYTESEVSQRMTGIQSHGLPSNFINMNTVPFVYFMNITLKSPTILDQSVTVTCLLTWDGSQ